MEQLPPRRPARRKLSFGDMVGMGSSKASSRTTVQHNDDNSTILRKVTPWLILVALAAFLFDWLRPGSARNTVYSKPGQLLEMQWKGKVVKKFLDEKNQNHPTIMLIDSLKQPIMLDFSREKTGFWDRVEINNSLSKPTGSLTVRVKTYVRDTTLVMEFE
jgi:hypothetical protein